MEAKRKLTFWLNINRPSMQFKTDGVSCWYRKANETIWKWSDAPVPTWPSKWRTVVGVKELEREDG